MAHKNYDGPEAKALQAKHVAAVQRADSYFAATSAEFKAAWNARTEQSFPVEAKRLGELLAEVDATAGAYYTQFPPRG